MFSITFAVFNLVQPSRHRADVAVAIALNCKPHLLKAKKQSKRGAVCLSHGWNKKTHTLYINIAIRVEDNRFSSLLARFVWYVPPVHIVVLSRTIFVVISSSPSTVCVSTTLHTHHPPALAFISPVPTATLSALACR